MKDILSQEEVDEMVERVVPDKRKEQIPTTPSILRGNQLGYRSVPVQCPHSEEHHKDSLMYVVKEPYQIGDVGEYYVRCKKGHVSEAMVPLRKVDRIIEGVQFARDLSTIARIGGHQALIDRADVFLVDIMMSPLEQVSLWLHYNAPKTASEAAYVLASPSVKKILGGEEVLAISGALTQSNGSLRHLNKNVRDYLESYSRP